MLQIMFETFSVPSVYIGIAGELSLYGAGRTTGLVCESGDEITQIVPIFEGNRNYSDTSMLNIGGRDVTLQVGKCLRGHKTSFYNLLEDDRMIKEALCSIPREYDNGFSFMTSS